MFLNKIFHRFRKKRYLRYFQNIITWLAAPEKHILRNNFIGGKDFRPKTINININWNDKWNGFKERAKNLNYPENMKTLFAVDCSDSPNANNNLYFSKLRELVNKYYNSSRGDKFYTWGSNYYYKSKSEIDDFISNKSRKEGKRCSHIIAEIGKITKSEDFKHLIIVSDGSVDYSEIDESDKKVSKYGLKYQFVSIYIIGNGGDESVGCAYSRRNPGITFLIDDYGNEKHLSSLPREDQKTLEYINLIDNWTKFKSKYQN